MWILISLFIILITISIYIHSTRSTKKIDTRKLDKKQTIKIGFLHPDLGIGGAENLIVNAACILQQRGYSVHLYTTHHDVAHCFPETKPDGELGNCITVYGDFLPSSILGSCHALCASIRMIYCTIRVLLSSNLYHVFFVDQISTCVPILKLFSRSKVLFYCHFPDKLLCVERSFVLKRMYRWFMDHLEERTIIFSDFILVNSNFTRSIVEKSFRSLVRCHSLNVLYPPVKIEQFPFYELSNDDEITFLSLNRYERKKNIVLALNAFNELKNLLDDVSIFCKLRLIIAGGYDVLNQENIEYYSELQEEIKLKKLDHQVKLYRSISNNEKDLFLKKCCCVLYTPSKEHFGIVPVEAMCCGRIVIAVNNGGPLESIVHEQTGFLCEPTPLAFAQAMKKCVDNKQNTLKQMGQEARKRVINQFSLNSFGDALEKHLNTILFSSNSSLLSSNS